MKKVTKKKFIQKVDWFIDNKSRMSRSRRRWYLDALEERYVDFIPYEKYGYYGEGIDEYVNDRICKRKRNVTNA